MNEATSTSNQVHGTGNGFAMGQLSRTLPSGQQPRYDSDFVRKIAETYATRVGLIAAGLASTVIIARSLGPDGRGIYAVAVATGVLGVQFGNAGMHTANSYFVAREPGLLAPLVGNSLALSFGFGALISCLLATVLHFSPDLLALHGVVLLLALISIPFGLAYLLLQNLMLGLHDVRGYNLLEMVSKILPLTLIASLVLLGRGSVEAFLAAGFLAVTVCCFWMWLRLRTRFGRGGVLS